MKRFLLASLLVVTSAFAQRVPWTVETTAVPSALAGDPAFLSVPGPGQSSQFIVGTDSMQGVFFWPPGGQPQQQAVGPVISADAREDIVVVTSAVANALFVFRVTGGGIAQLDTGTFNVPTPGQIALARAGDAGFELWVDVSSTELRHHRMRVNAALGTATFTTLSPVAVPEAVSGLAIDDRTGLLYVGQPSLGVMTVEPNGTTNFLISIDAGTLGDVVGGIDLFQIADGGVLIFSTALQGEVRVHEHGGGQVAFRATLTIGDTDGGSGLISSTKHLDVFEESVPLFPKGVLVVQDELSANYKVVSLADVDAVLPLPPPFNPGMVSSPIDAGVGDGGVSDGGTGGGAGGGSGGIGTAGGNGSAKPPATAEPNPSSCGCTGGPFALLPALLALWCIRRRRFSP